MYIINKEFYQVKKKPKGSGALKDLARMNQQKRNLPIAKAVTSNTSIV